MKKFSKRIIGMLLILQMGILTACRNGQAEELSNQIKGDDISSVEITAPAYEEVNPKEGLTDFALNMMKENYEEENILLSPLSIVLALGMTANGGANNTLLEVETMLHADSDSLNDFLEAYVSYLPSGEKYRVNIANSIWIKDKEGLSVSDDFLRENKTYYDADVFKAAFDEQTKDEINDWVKVETDDMITKLLDQIPEAAVMYLINALSFDAEWAEIYQNTAIHEGTFTSRSEEEQNVEFMYSEENSYIEMENATGFIKPYADHKYAFVALLPNEDVGMADFVENLNGESLSSAFENATSDMVYAGIPKFTVEYDTLLNDSLIDLGMKDAFDPEDADFSDLAQSEDGKIYISRVIHKTKIEVDERGTKAGAVTAVEMCESAAFIEEPKEVILDRPFVYMIIDTEQNFPIFMGVLNSISE